MTDSKVDEDELSSVQMTNLVTVRALSPTNPGPDKLPKNNTDENDDNDNPYRTGAESTLRHPNSAGGSKGIDGDNSSQTLLDPIKPYDLSGNNKEGKINLANDYLRNDVSFQPSGSTLANHQGAKKVSRVFSPTGSNATVNLPPLKQSQNDQQRIVTIKTLNNMDRMRNVMSGHVQSQN